MAFVNGVQNDSIFFYFCLFGNSKWIGWKMFNSNALLNWIVVLLTWKSVSLVSCIHYLTQYTSGRVKEFVCLYFSIFIAFLLYQTFLILCMIIILLSWPLSAFQTSRGLRPPHDSLWPSHMSHTNIEDCYPVTSYKVSNIDFHLLFKKYMKYVFQ